jgi:hypothetical protein
MNEPNGTSGTPSELSGETSLIGARLALTAGLTAVALAVAYARLSGGFQSLSPAAGSGGELLGTVIVSIVFQFGTPFLCLAAFYFGLPVRRLWPARIGMLLAIAALAAYMVFVRACYSLL